MAAPVSSDDSPSVTNDPSVSSIADNPGLDTHLTSPQSALPPADDSSLRRRPTNGKKPDSTSHSRHASSNSRGREFRVGNVGNNGMIYLRPIKRSSHTPTATSSSADTAARQTATPTSSDPEWRHSIMSATGTQASNGLRDSVASTSPPPAPRTPKDTANFNQHAPLSTAEEKGPTKSSPSRGTLKVVIDRADEESVPTPLYDVAIPHYRLGTPHFTGKGSAVLHSSINTGSSALDSETPIDDQPVARTFHTPNPSGRTPERARPQSHASSEPPDLTPDRQPDRNILTSELLFQKDVQKGAVGSADVRVSRVSGQILAASIPQLIVHITSPFRLDYDLLSDFFLTFRLFMAPGDLAMKLLQRLRASVGSGDGTSRIVRVRTFVALRHWILNYFVDDFVTDMELRIQFCDTVNSLCRDVREVNSQTVGDLRILGELKRCWKHTCALFWDVPMDPLADHMEQDIYPGGIIGSRSLPQDQTAAIESERRSREPSPSRAPPTAEGHSPTRLSTRGTQAGPHFAVNQTSALQSSTSLSRPGLKSARSERHSMHVLSCTLPTHNKLARQPSKGPRPVPAAGSARAQTKKSQQAGETSRRHHNRSGSFSDALRDDRAPLPAPQGSETGQSQPLQMVVPGSLIRGAMISPASPFVESIMPRSPMALAHEHHRRRASDAVATDPSERQGHFHSPNVRRFIGNVRRALSVKNYTTRPLSGNLETRNRSCSSIASHGPVIAAPLVEPGVPRRKLIGGQTILRVDLLGAKIGECFNEAVREASEAQRAAEAAELYARIPDYIHTDPTAGGDNMLRLPKAHNKVNSNITMGSHSIIIADDTNGQMTPRPDMVGFGARMSEALSSVPGAQEVPVFLDSPSATNDVFIDGNGETIPNDLARKVGLADARASQLSNANNLQDVTAVSLQERIKAMENDETVSFSDNTSTNDPFSYERGPLHQIRRMPGGDLRAAQHIHSLDHQLPSMLPPPSSANATSTFTPEAAGETLPSSTTSHPLQHVAFEQEVAKLADIPDPSEEGGIESALRKLEGRRASTPDDAERGDLMARLAAQLEGRLPEQTAQHSRQRSKTHRAEEVLELPIGIEPTSQQTLQTLGHRTIHVGEKDGSEQARIVLQSKPRSTSGSEASHSSIPLLQRGVDSQPPFKRTNEETRPGDVSKKHSPEEDEAGGAWPRPDASRADPDAHRSFLLDDDHSESDHSATTADDGSDARPSTGMRSFFDADDEPADEGRATPRPEISRPENPLGRASTATPYWHERSQSEGTQTYPRLSHTSKSKSVNDLSQVAQPAPLSTTPGAAHLCFVLAYDSQLLAQQFTVVERDALCEVEWRDLIDLRWNQSAAAHSNWVDFLRSKGHEPSGLEVRVGVDMCIARFNLVVRWAKSEIVLTEDINERAATVIKYIHIAQHCRRLRNWATMYQLTMALVGSDISRLSQTWELVPAKDKELLAELEELIMPTKNFYNLREEIESATETFGQDGDGGCIPFIGIYTHDLIYNAQKPMYVATGPTTTTNGGGGEAMLPSGLPPALVNFERHHTAATIVKNLLRLIEASSKYSFQPLPEVAARCLWFAALSDEEVSRKSLLIEPGLPRPLPL